MKKAPTKSFCLSSGTTIEDRAPGLVGEGLDKRDLLIGERFDLQSVDGDHAHQVVTFEHRDCDNCSDRLHIPQKVRNIGVSLNVGYVYRSPLEGSACRDGFLSRGDRVPIYELPEFWANVVVRYRSEKLAVEAVDKRSLSFT
jgi:hypothetical protein